MRQHNYSKECCATIGCEAFPLKCIPSNDNENIYYSKGKKDVKEEWIPKHLRICF